MIYYIFAFICIILAIILKPKKLNEGSLAFLGVALLLPTGLIKFKDIFNALSGNEFLKPLYIVIILITLAIITTALDEYGFFKFSAYKAIILSNNNGLALFRNFFILTILLTGFTSNDIDVLTVTPIVLWFAQTTKINPIPYLFSVFVAANTSSMEFVIGNLTNIIISNVFHLKFISFFLIMILPTALTLLGQFWIMRLLFKKMLPKKIVDENKLKEIHEKIDKPLENKNINYFLLAVLFLVVIGSALSDFFNYQIWQVTTLGALIILMSGQFNIKKRLTAIPWNVVVFVLSFMVLTYKLQTYLDVNTLIDKGNFIIKSTWISIFFSGFLSALTSGVINNIPSAISLSNIFYTIAQTSSLAIKESLAYGLVIGTNLGALLTPFGALATILWLTLIRKKGYEFPIKKFLYYGCVVGFSSITIACLTTGIGIIITK